MIRFFVLFNLFLKKKTSVNKRNVVNMLYLPLKCSDVEVRRSRKWEHCDTHTVIHV